jgi:peptidyl-Lys metalloendopeptidase
MTEKGEEKFNKIRYLLTAKDSYTEKDPIVINFTLQNTQDEKLWVLKWYTPLEGLKGDIFRVICDGNEIRYEGIMVKRGQPSKADYTHIEPGRSVSTEVDLSMAYQIPESQSCTVTFNGMIYDYSASSNSIPKRESEQQMVNISGNSITFRVLKNG